ncbi:hypothetical protein [Geobacter sp.]|uniref:hypothetical protein n=1 Tax=Geobacter sp. TaxID=46610 RepID=UPI0027BA15E0|nr:hypothetical protein [Geobacter sp.]
MTLDYHPISRLNGLIPCFRKVVKGFKDNGDYWLILHFYQGGLRSPRILDAGDKQKVKKELADFLQVWGKPLFTGQVAFYMKHAEFSDLFNVYPGSGSFDEYQKEGIQYEAVSFKEYNAGYDDPWFYRIDEKSIIKKKDPMDDIPF